MAAGVWTGAVVAPHIQGDQGYMFGYLTDDTEELMLLRRVLLEQVV